MHPIFLAGLLFMALPQASPSPAPPRPAVSADDLTAEVQRAVAAYNARDLSYYEAVLDPKSVYIAEDGAVISGRVRSRYRTDSQSSADPAGRALQCPGLPAAEYGTFHRGMGPREGSRIIRSTVPRE